MKKYTFSIWRIFRTGSHFIFLSFMSRFGSVSDMRWGVELSFSTTTNFIPKKDEVEDLKHIRHHEKDEFPTLSHQAVRLQYNCEYSHFYWSQKSSLINFKVYFKTYCSPDYTIIIIIIILPRYPLISFIWK